jgi:hypothetical protein
MHPLMSSWQVNIIFFVVILHRSVDGNWNLQRRASFYNFGNMTSKKNITQTQRNGSEGGFSNETIDVYEPEIELEDELEGELEEKRRSKLLLHSVDGIF